MPPKRNRQTYLLLAFLLMLGYLPSGCDRPDDNPTKVSLSVTEEGEIIPATDTHPVLRIAIAAVISPKETFLLYQDLLDYMAREIGVNIDLIQRQTYEEVNALVRDNRVDLAMVCSGAYVDGHDQFGMELLVAPVAYGVPFYHSYIIVPEESKAQGMEDLRGKRFAFTDPMSNTGKLSPTYLLAQMHEDIDTFFQEYIYTYSHDRSIEMVAHALVDGAAVDGLIWQYLNRTKPGLTSQTRIINKSEPYGIPPVVVPASLNQQTKEKLRNLFLNLHNEEEGKKILNKLFIDKFIVVEDRQYDSIRKMRTMVSGQ
jgi:phosphonate transport system substrate-binding protein